MVNEEIFNKIKQEQKLKCSYIEFNDYYNNVSNLKFEIDYSFHKFNKLYNGIEIENLTTNDDALYYILTINGTVYLQNIQPFVNGIHEITEENKMNIIENHINIIKSQMNNMYKLEETINHFKDKYIKEEVEEE